MVSGDVQAELGHVKMGAKGVACKAVSVLGVQLMSKAQRSQSAPRPIG